MDNLKSAVERLKEAGCQGTGASAGAATVLLFGWNDAHPIRGLFSLDRTNRAAALLVIDAALRDRLDGGQVIEEIVGWETMDRFSKSYGVNGSAWQK